MRVRAFRIILPILLLIVLSSCFFPSNDEKSGAGESRLPLMDLDKPERIEDKFSYAYGYLFASTIEEQPDIREEYFLKGMLDYFGDPFYDEEEIDDILAEYQMRRIVIAETKRESLSKLNKENAEAFLEINGKRSGVVTLESGIEYEVLDKSGSGVKPSEGDDVVIDYQVTLSDGRLADASYDRGGATRLPLSSLVEGFREAILVMEEGDSYRVWIPPELGYGEEGKGDVGPNELLVFEVVLSDVINDGN